MKLSKTPSAVRVIGLPVQKTVGPLMVGGSVGGGTISIMMSTVVVKGGTPSSVPVNVTM